MQPASQLGALACCLTALTTAAAAVADRAVARRGREVWQCTLSQCKQRWPVRSRCQALCSSSSSCMGSIWQRCRVMIVWRDALVVWGHTLCGSLISQLTHTCVGWWRSLHTVLVHMLHIHHPHSVTTEHAAACALPAVSSILLLCCMAVPGSTVVTGWHICDCTRQLALLGGAACFAVMML
ncbi:hypothetical protein COO60DRAFT_615391 [Scenedesmus sp. NREL 46B-D3]|nr:hypothetical protein COO60DRAFT_615391 [Scenedesmus sp. NREL 46B-D3]